MAPFQRCLTARGLLTCRPGLQVAKWSHGPNGPSGPYIPPWERKCLPKCTPAWYPHIVLYVYIFYVNSVYMLNIHIFRHICRIVYCMQMPKGTGSRVPYCPGGSAARFTTFCRLGFFCRGRFLCFGLAIGKLVRGEATSLQVQTKLT